MVRKHVNFMKALDVRTKITLVLGISLLAVTLDQWFSLLGLSLFSLGLFLGARPQKAHLKGTFFLLGLSTWGLVVSQGIFYQNFPRIVLFYLVPPFELWGHSFGGLAVYLQGLYYGAVQSLRFSAALLAGLALCVSTSVERLYYALAALPLPRGVSFLSVSAIRFLPIVAQELQNVRKALRLKGYRPWRCGLLETVRTELCVPLPVLSGAVRRARDLADALLTRGFDPLAPTTRPPEPWPWIERLLVCGFWGFCLAVAVAKFLFWLYLQEILYIESLRPIYAFCRNWL